MPTRTEGLSCLQLWVASQCVTCLHLITKGCYLSLHALQSLRGSPPKRAAASTSPHAPCSTRLGGQMDSPGESNLTAAIISRGVIAKGRVWCLSPGMCRGARLMPGVRGPSAGRISTADIIRCLMCSFSALKPGRCYSCTHSRF
jgi:hypothetical protein